MLLWSKPESLDGLIICWIIWLVQDLKRMMPWNGYPIFWGITLASEALGLPLVERLDDASAQAMWSDANINVTQQQIIKKHLCFHFGKLVFVPEKEISRDCESYFIPTVYGEYKHYKKGDRSHKPERCSYWCRDASIVVSKELERLLDYSVDNSESLSKINSIASSCTLITGADHGQGAWQSWLKISTMSGAEVRKRMARDESFDPKTAFVTLQLAHTTCKKDHHEILAGSVSKDISAAYEKLLSSSLVFIKAPNKDKVRSVYLSKHAKEITIDSGSLTYTL